MTSNTPSVAVVTGANSGIGRATALHLASAGYRVFGTVRSLDKAGKLYLDGKLATEAGVVEEVKARVKSDPAVTALVSADRSASHGTVVGLLDLLRVHGVKDVALNTKAQDIQGGQ